MSYKILRLYSTMFVATVFSQKVWRFSWRKNVKLLQLWSKGEVQGIMATPASFGGARFSCVTTAGKKMDEAKEMATGLILPLARGCAALRRAYNSRPPWQYQQPKLVT